MKYYITGNLKKDEDIIYILKQKTSIIILTNHSSKINFLGAKAVHHCFVSLLKLFIIKKVIFNIGDNLPGLMIIINFNYQNIKHSFTSQRVKLVIENYKKTL